MGGFHTRYYCNCSRTGRGRGRRGRRKGGKREGRIKRIMSITNTSPSYHSFSHFFFLFNRAVGTLVSDAEE